MPAPGEGLVRQAQSALTGQGRGGGQLLGQLVEVVSRLRGLDLRKSPSIAESIDWARTLVALGTGTLDEAAIAQTLGVVLKHHSDHERALKELRLRTR